MSALPRVAAYVRLDELTDAEQRRYHATLAMKRREYPHLYQGEAAKAGLRRRILNERNP